MQIIESDSVLHICNSRLISVQGLANMKKKVICFQCFFLRFLTTEFNIGYAYSTWFSDILSVISLQNE